MPGRRPCANSRGVGHGISGVPAVIARANKTEVVILGQAVLHETTLGSGVDMLTRATVIFIGAAATLENFDQAFVFVAVNIKARSHVGIGAGVRDRQSGATNLVQGCPKPSSVWVPSREWRKIGAGFSAQITL